MNEEEKIEKLAAEVMGWHKEWAEPLNKRWQYIAWFSQDSPNRVTYQAKVGDWDPFANWNDAMMIMDKQVEEGACLVLVNDNFGHWTVIDNGLQPMEEKPPWITFVTDNTTIWHDTAPRAISEAAWKTLGAK